MEKVQNTSKPIDMRAPKAWQIAVGFKKPFQKLFKKTPERPAVDKEFFREPGESVYYQAKGERKKRKRRKRLENKSRAMMYKRRRAS